MRVIDITVNLDENVRIYEGDPRFEKKQLTYIEEHGYSISRLSMGTHTGTHVDAPSHFIKDGKSLGEISLRRFVGKCVVVDRFDPDRMLGYSRVIIKGHCKLNPEQAGKLIEMGVRLVGTDRLSIGGDDVHKVLLGSECVVLECLKLDEAECGEYILNALPLKIDADGSPIRACLIVMDE